MTNKEQLTKRETVALACLSGMHARSAYSLGLTTPQQRAKLAFIDADAFLAESSKTPGSET